MLPEKGAKVLQVTLFTFQLKAVSGLSMIGEITCGTNTAYFLSLAVCCNLLFISCLKKNLGTLKP